MIKRITKPYVIGLIKGRLLEDSPRIVEGQAYVDKDVFVYYKNSAELHPIKLDKLQLSTLEDIFDVLLSDPDSPIEI